MLATGLDEYERSGADSRSRARTSWSDLRALGDVREGVGVEVELSRGGTVDGAWVAVVGAEGAGAGDSGLVNHAREPRSSPEVCCLG
jgi:hypothetical protein